MDRGAPEDPVEVEERLWEGADGDVGWDVGSNMGQSVGRMLARGFTEILAFEPALESYEVLLKDYGSNPAVRTFGMAISDHTGKLVVAERSAPIMTGQLTATDMPYRGEGQGSPGMANWGPDIGTRTVQCETLDVIAAQYGIPDFIKVDTEGHEGQVLAGAEAVLADGSAGWLIEFHDDWLHDQCVAALQAAGYDPVTVRHPHYPEGSWMWSRHGWIKAAPVPTP